MTIDEDARDLAIHESIDNLVNAMMFANGWTRTQALSRIVGYLENDEDSPAFTTNAGKPRKRPRKVNAEAHA